MGLFGSIFKAVKGVARAGLSVATGGVSDKVIGVAGKVISGLKNRGAAKQVAASPDLTSQQLALVNKMGSLSPRTKTTESVLHDVRREVLQGGAASYGTKRMPGRAKKKPSLARAPKMPKTGSKRTVPRGGLDLKQISAMWAAAGKPGRWADFIKANSHIRKA